MKQQQPYSELIKNLNLNVNVNPNENENDGNVTRSHDTTATATTTTTITNKAGRNRGRSKTQKPIDTVAAAAVAAAAKTRGKERNKLRNSKGSQHRNKQQQQQQQTPLSSSPLAQQNKSYKSCSSSNNNNNNNNKTNKKTFPPHLAYKECMALYTSNNLVRGTLRVVPGKDASAFVTCDRGSTKEDILVATNLERNRALHGDLVFVKLLDEEDDNEDEDEEDDNKVDNENNDIDNANQVAALTLQEEHMWQDDSTQVHLWNPLVPIRRGTDFSPMMDTANMAAAGGPLPRRRGRVVHVLPPTLHLTCEIQTPNYDPSTASGMTPKKTIVGLLKFMTRRDGTKLYLLTPSKKSLPQFLTPPFFKPTEGEDGIYRAEYEYGSWKEGHVWPPCTNVQFIGHSCNVEDETMALLIEHGVDHGEFESDVLKDVQDVVASGLYTSHNDIGWKPTPEMYVGRRDYRTQRIFTIDPTTARDLDDALHITQLPNGTVEMGVHIADVSYFVQPEHPVDNEAQRRATTVYLVDRVLPMLPRPLCEVACSLNENVERLAFSCVWTMNMDGTLTGDEVWYGRTVIKSCARLDYATAQNIIDGTILDTNGNLDETLWPSSRRPTGHHSVDQVAADVRLMHKVAMARRKLRFDNGAIALTGVKMTFRLDADGETPNLCAPYPIRDSNKLIEEYMLLANFLVAQRLITHTGPLACLRHHPPPLMQGLQNAVQIAMEGKGFVIDLESSQTLQQSLSRLGRECDDELVMQCVTEMLMVPMRAAEYMAAGNFNQEEWKHFALNIPYYTHFTSPIRRYPDIIVHRLLQATLDGTVDEFHWDQGDIQSICSHCNEKKMSSKYAQDRSDRVFLSLYLKKHPLRDALGVVLSVGETTFTVYVPSIGVSGMVFLAEHKDLVTFEPYVHKSGRVEGGEKRIRLTAISKSKTWSTIEIKVFCKLSVTVTCKDKPPIDVKLSLQGPWVEHA